MKKLALFALAMFLISGVVMASLTISGHVHPERLAERFLALGDSAAGRWTAAAIIVGLLTVDLALPIPSKILMLVAGKVLGPFLGAAVSTLGAMMAGAIGYLGCRYVGRRFFDRLVSPESAAQANACLRDYGVAALMASRLFPMMPEMLSCLAGIAKMPAPQFFVGFFLGTAPLAIACGFAGHHTTLEMPWPSVAIIAAVPLAAWWSGRWFWKAARRANAEAPPPQSVEADEAASA